MATISTIAATARPRSGKGAARTARREGNVPAVIYGAKQQPETIVIDSNAITKLINKGKFLSTVFELDVSGKKSKVLPRDIQFDPVRDFPIHVDFQRIGADGKIRVFVPAKFINDAASPGLKRGGVLNIVRHQIEVICPYDKIPEAFEFDLTGLEIGRSIHISSVKMPDGVHPTITNRDFTVATVAGASAKNEVDEVTPGAAAAAEGAEAEAAVAAAGGDAKAAAAAGKGAAAAKGGAAPAKAGGDAKAAPKK